MARKIFKILLWVLATPIILLLLVTTLLYIPFVQDKVVDIASSELSRSSGMTIDIGRLRLGFPLKLRLSDVSVIEAGGDTMLTASGAGVRVALLPLLKGRVEAEDISLRDAFYQLGNSDSVLWLRANIARGDISTVGIGLSDNLIDLDRAVISGVRVRMRMLPDSTVTPTDTTASTPWLIRANSIDLKDLSYSMEMLPLIDSLGCTLETAALRQASIDMGRNTIHGRLLAIDSVSAAYIYPAMSDTTATASADSDDSTTTQPWTITADSLRLTAREGLYAQRGVLPAPGFDPAYIAVSGVEIAIDSFYNRGTSIRVPVKRIAATERCGLPLRANGLFAMDSSAMNLTDFSIATDRSTLSVNAMMGMGQLSGPTPVPLSLKGSGLIAPADIILAFPDFRAMLSPLGLLSLSTDIDGSSSSLNIYDLSLDMPSVFKLKGTGTISQPFDPEKTGAAVTLSGSLASMSDKQYSFLPIPSVPALSLLTDIDYRPGEASGSLEVTTRDGRLAADGSWKARPEDYDLTLDLERFPVDRFMPSLGVGPITAKLTVDGRGYNPMARTTSIDATVALADATYLDRRYSDIRLQATLHAGHASAFLDSRNPGADASLNLDAMINGDSIHYNFDANLRDINLLTLNLSDSINGGHLNLSSEGVYNTATNGFDLSATASDLRWQLPGITIAPTSALTLTSRSGSDGSLTNLSNGDLRMRLATPLSLPDAIAQLPTAMTVISGQIDSMRVNVPALSAAMPKFDLTASLGPDNIASQFLASSSDITFRRAVASISNDSLIHFNALVNSILSGSTRIDTLSISANQKGEYLIYDLAMNNRPGTWDDFAHVSLNGFAGVNHLSSFLRQSNIKGENGFTLGFNTELTDSIVHVGIVPGKPTIAYKPWKINPDNYLTYDLATKHLDADINLSGDNSSLRIFTEHSLSHDHDADSTDIADGIRDIMLSDTPASHRFHGEQEDLVIQLSNIHLQDWLAINPFAPPVKGDVSANLRLNYNNSILTGRGSVTLDELYYGRERVGDFDLALDVANSAGGHLMADVTLMVDSIPTITARGALNDSSLSTPFLLDFRMIRFPLAVVNPFLPPATASLSGMLNGEMTITGDMAAPIFNGHINFDTAAVKVAMMGTTFTFSDTNIPVDSNVVTFNDFAITGCNKNPLLINGKVDASHISDINIDLDASARNMQILKSDRARGDASLYGKAFIDLFAAIKGNLNRMNVTADLSLLPETNLTYVVSEMEESLTQSSSSEMVHFVQFNDTVAVEKADSLTTSTMALNVSADLHLAQGAVINVDLSPGGSNKVQLKPMGDLDYSLSPLNGQRLTGRLNILGGFVRYTPPLMSEKNFQFSDGSYIAFNGDIMDPVLNIHAVDVIRSNVTQDGQNSRLVNFDVMLAVTNSFSNMNVAFDLSTNDDITVQNQLQAMSAEQRANQAMNLLLYNVYTGAGGTKGTTVAGNPLYSFLTSQLNSWAANNIRGVDISFGIDQYDRTYEGATSTATSYSYKVSKSLFDDRFKIVVGGNYSTDADSDENFSQNLINDISFEYLLNRSGTMYVRIFRHTGYESILEGEVTKTGVGFVLKRKLASLRNIFNRR